MALVSPVIGRFVCRDLVSMKVKGSLYGIVGHYRFFILTLVILLRLEPCFTPIILNVRDHVF